MRVPAAADSSRISVLRAGLDRIFSDPLFAAAQWGVEILSLDRGELIYERNSGKLFIPASNNKLPTAAAALLRLGPDFTFETRICSDGELADGTLKGSLIIVGSGDPTLSPRFSSGESFLVFRQWASKLKELGIRRIDGDILGVDGAFERNMLGKSWARDNLAYGYSAPVSALQYHDNQVTVEILPGEKEGDRASARVEPAVGYFTIDCLVTTAPAGAEPEVTVERGDSDGFLTLRGSVPLHGRPVRQSVSVDNPSLFFLRTLKDTLGSEGIDVTACSTRVLRSTGSPNLVTFWTEHSPRLSDILKPLLKTSQNLYAETLVRALGSRFRSDGSFVKGQELVEETLRGMAIEKGTYSYADGSGLSRLNLISPDQVVRLLKYMSRHSWFDHFYDALPIAGVDGTIEGRMKGTRAEGNVRAKTGTLGHVRCLSGYLKTADGELLAFSMLANNFLVSNRSAEYVQDAALELLANFTR